MARDSSPTSGSENGVGSWGQFCTYTIGVSSPMLAWQWVGQAPLRHPPGPQGRGRDSFPVAGKGWGQLSRALEQPQGAAQTTNIGIAQHTGFTHQRRPLPTVGLQT